MPDTITIDDAQYAMDIVKTICAEVGPGLPGSPQERERAAIIAKELESHLGAGNVATEEFTVARGAFMDSMQISGLCLLAAALLNIATGRLAGISPWVTALAALVLSVLAVLAFIFLFLLGATFLDPLFEKRQSVNVIGALRRPGTEKVKHLLILSGHHDSALENTWLSTVGYGFYVLSTTCFIGLGVMLAASAIQLIGVITANPGLTGFGTIGWPLLVYPIAPSIIFAVFVTRGRQGGGIVPGAVDNLAASALAVTMARFLAQNPALIPPETEIRFISFGSEEAGLRGSRRYVERHLPELRRLDTRLLNVEMVAHPEIAIFTSDLNGTVKNSPEMVRSVVAAAGRAEVPYAVKAASLGVGTDACPFSQAGLKAATLIPFKMPQQFVAFYHQRQDGPENLTLEPLFNVLKLACEWVRHGGE